MEKFAKVIQDTERHLQFSERSAADLNRRIQEISRACSVAERNVEESTNAIAASDRNLSILASQQSDTRKKLSALYRNLIAIPTSTQRSVELKSTSNTVTDLVTQAPEKAVRDRVIFGLCMFNSLVHTGEVGCLVRHTYFVQAGLRQAEEVLRGVQQFPHTQPMSVDETQEEDDVNPGENVSVDAIMPLCMYSLTGTCTDKV